MTSGPFTGAKRLRELLKDPEKIVVCPGVYDGLTARLALSKGFDALYMVRTRLFVLETLRPYRKSRLANRLPF